MSGVVEDAYGNGKKRKAERGEGIVGPQEVICVVKPHGIVEAGPRPNKEGGCCSGVMRPHKETLADKMLGTPRTKSIKREERRMEYGWNQKSRRES